MNVFKVYFKIIKSNLAAILLYTFIFFGILLLNFFARSYNGETGYVAEKQQIAIINRDEDSEIIDGLRDYLSVSNDIVELEDNESVLRDALFYREATYIIIVPEKFSSNFGTDNELLLENMVVLDSNASVYINNSVNSYFSTWKTYKSLNTDLNENKISELVSKDLKNEVTVELTKRENTKKENKVKLYVNLAAYGLVGTILMAISLAMSTLNGTEIKRRTSCSPKKMSENQRQIIFANVVLGLSICVIYVVGAYCCLGKQVINKAGILLGINLLIFCTVVTCMGVLVSYLTKKKDVQMAITTSVSLGMAFVSGVFVPQNMLGKNVLVVAKISPMYWFVRANDEIVELTSYQLKDLSDIFSYYGVQIVFSVAFICLALVATKRLASSET